VASRSTAASANVSQNPGGGRHGGNGGGRGGGGSGTCSSTAAWREGGCAEAAEGRGRASCRGLAVGAKRNSSGFRQATALSFFRSGRWRRPTVAVRFEEDAGVGVHAKVAEKAAQTPGRRASRRADKKKAQGTRQSDKHGDRGS
jgi:hypothetical protein